jgi:hypothetical protein
MRIFLQVWIILNGSLGDLPVLAKTAMKITANTSHRKDIFAGIIMIQGLFFNRIQMQGAHLAIVFTEELPVHIPPYPANSGLSRFENTLMRA